MHVYGAAVLFLDREGRPRCARSPSNGSPGAMCTIYGPGSMARTFRARAATMTPLRSRRTLCASGQINRGMTSAPGGVPGGRAFLMTDSVATPADTCRGHRPHKHVAVCESRLSRQFLKWLWPSPRLTARSA